MKSLPLYKNYLILFLFLFTFLLPLQASASQDDLLSVSEKALKGRVEQLWQAKVADDRGMIYDMADIKFRKSLSRMNFIKRPAITINEFKISATEIKQDGKSATSTVLFKTVRLGRLMDMLMKEIWLFEDGVWNIKLSDPTNPFAPKSK